MACITDNSGIAACSLTSINSHVIFNERNIDSAAMGSQDVSLHIDADIAETQKLLTITTRPVVQERLLQLLGSLQQVT